MLEPLPEASSDDERRAQYRAVFERIDAILDGESDWVAAMATVACELHHSFDYYDWTGFYRVVAPQLMKLGPYQGRHGCLEISFDRGVCGAAAAKQRTMLVPDVHAFPGHIACSSSTLSEVVVPILSRSGDVIAVLDVDSDAAAAFREVDAEALESLCRDLGFRFSAAP